MLLLNKASQSDPVQNAVWQRQYANETTACLLTDCVTGDGMNRLAPAIRELLSEKLQRYESKGMAGRRLRAMVLGVPNV